MRSASSLRKRCIRPASLDRQTWKTLLERGKVLRAKRGEICFVGEENCEKNGNPGRRYHVLALAIVLPVVLVILPGFLLILGLGRAAGKDRPRPADASAMSGLSRERPDAVQLQLFRPRENKIRRLAKADLN